MGEFLQVGRMFWYVDADGFPVGTVWDDDHEDCHTIGNVFRTEQEAENTIRALKLIAKIAKERRELNGDWKPKWYDDDGKLTITNFRGTVEYQGYSWTNTATPFGFFESRSDINTGFEAEYYMKD